MAACPGRCLPTGVLTSKDNLTDAKGHGVKDAAFAKETGTVGAGHG